MKRANGNPAILVRHSGDPEQLVAEVRNSWIQEEQPRDIVYAYISLYFHVFHVFLHILTYFYVYTTCS